MSSRTVRALSVALVLLLAGCLGAVPPTSGLGATAHADANTTIGVGAAAEVSAPPDLALVRLAVVATAPDADTARQRAADDVAAMRSALAELGVADDDVRTSYYFLTAVYDDDADGREIVRFRVAHGFEIEADVDAAGAVIDAAVASGANQVDGVGFTLTESTRRDVRAEAIRLAISNARGDAEVVAAESGLTITGVDSASTSDVGFVPVDGLYERAAGDAGGTVIEPGQVRVSAAVSITYRAA